MELIKADRYSCEYTLKNSINKQKKCFVYGVVDKNYVFINGNSYDEEKRKELDIQILKTPVDIGGSLVLSEGDVEIGLFVSETEGDYYLTDFVEYFLKFLHEKDIPAIYNGNDILVHGYKVAGIARMLKNNITYIAMHIALNVNLELIRQICTKEMTKEPKGLTEFGVTTEEVVQLIKDYAESR